MWQYLAGLFDGDGCPSIAKVKRKNPNVQFRAIITGRNKEQFKKIVLFLKEQDIYAGVYKANIGKHKTKDGWRKHTSYKLCIASNAGVKKFMENIFPFIIFKRQQCEIMLNAVRLKEEIKADKNRKIVDNFDLFDKFRHELHDLSVKGPRELKPW